MGEVDIAGDWCSSCVTEPEREAADIARLDRRRQVDRERSRRARQRRRARTNIPDPTAELEETSTP